MKRKDRTAPAVEDRRKEFPERGNVVPLRQRKHAPADPPQDRDPPPDSAA
jgi:hypothetical protein